MRTGQCFILYGEQRRCYFFTGITETENGKTILVMCEMFRKEQITEDSFIKISEEDYKTKIQDGTIEEF